MSGSSKVEMSAFLHDNSIYRALGGRHEQERDNYHGNARAGPA